MTKMNTIKQSLLAASLFAAFSTVNAAGFALIENNASGMGNAYAGAAAVAEDASTIFFNPAGMTYIDGMQAVGALHVIKTSGRFENEGSTPAFGFNPVGDEGGNLGDVAFVPNFYWMTTLTPEVKVGVGVNAPFGLKTEYDDDWIGRFHAVKSELKTININPSIAWKVNDKLSLGAGISAMYADAELTRQFNIAATEADVKIEGDDWGFGFNLGAIYQATKNTRFGIAYRSKVKQEVEGDSTSSFIGANANPTQTLNTDITATVTLPESFSASIFSHINAKWDLMADVTWTRWSRFEELRILRDNGTDTTLTVTEQNWENSLRYSIGTSYHYSDKVKLRAGLAYDEEPIKTEYRTARIPGNDRKWLTLGASYQMNDQSTFDIGYAHLFISDAKIDDDRTTDTPFGNGRITGSYDGSADILSVQYTHNF